MVVRNVLKKALGTISDEDWGFIYYYYFFEWAGIGELINNKYVYECTSLFALYPKLYVSYILFLVNYSFIYIY